MIFNRNKKYLDNLECLALLLCLTILISSGIFNFLSLANDVIDDRDSIEKFLNKRFFYVKSLNEIKICKEKKIFCGSNKSRTKEFNVMHNE